MMIRDHTSPDTPSSLHQTGKNDHCRCTSRVGIGSSQLAGVNEVASPRPDPLLQLLANNQLNMATVVRAGSSQVQFLALRGKDDSFFWCHLPRTSMPPLTNRRQLVNHLQDDLCCIFPHTVLEVASTSQVLTMFLVHTHAKFFSGVHRSSPRLIREYSSKQVKHDTKLRFLKV